MKLTVVVPAYNEEKYIGDCLAGLLASRSAELAEIIVVDNASTDRTAEIARSFPKVRVVYEPQKGLTRARQRGLLQTRTELVAYVDADTKIPPEWYPIIQREFASDSGLVALSGPYHYYDIASWKQACVKFYWNLLALPSYAFTGFMVIGGNFVAKTQALRKIGGFDSSISFYGEDANIARRLSKVGKVRFSPKFFVYTSGRRIAQEGLLRTGLRYSVNFVWEVLFHKPFTKTYKDIR